MKFRVKSKKARLTERLRAERRWQLVLLWLPRRFHEDDETIHWLCRATRINRHADVLGARPKWEYGPPSNFLTQPGVISDEMRLVYEARMKQMAQASAAIGSGINLAPHFAGASAQQASAIYAGSAAIGSKQ